jgi:hypothetical protein
MSASGSQLLSSWAVPVRTTGHLGSQPHIHLRRSNADLHLCNFKSERQMTSKTTAVEPAGYAADHLTNLAFDPPPYLVAANDEFRRTTCTESKRTSELDGLMQPARRQAAARSTLTPSL